LLVVYKAELLRNFSNTISLCGCDRLWRGSWLKCCCEASVRKPISRLMLMIARPTSHIRNLGNILATGLLISLIFWKLTV